jgi:hypothetical protein
MFQRMNKIRFRRRRCRRWNGLINARFLLAGVAVLVAAMSVGCQSNEMAGPPPAGPGVASHKDLTLWLADATHVTRTGMLREINVPSSQGSYETWSLAPDDDRLSVEVDIRGCTGPAQRWRNQIVTIEGRLIERKDPHFSLLVADRIRPAAGAIVSNDDAAQPRMICLIRDPVTDDFDPIVPFDPQPISTVAAAMP